jgi:SulP family sulfate permease
LPTLVVSGGIIALVGFAEAASVAQTFAEQAREEWDPNREFVSQGVANVAAGLFGGFPVGGSFSRSALNKHAGAMTRASGGVTGLTVLLALPFSSLLEPLPKAILGAIVVGAVSKLLDPRPVLEIWPQSRPQAAIAAGTFLLTLALSPHVEYAVLGGIAFALAAHIWRETKVDVRETIVGDTLVLRPRGVIWFASAPLFRQALSGAIARNHEIRRVILDLGGIGRLDLTGGYALNAIADGARQAGVDFSFGEVPPPCERIVRIVCSDVPRAPNHAEQQLALALPASDSGGTDEAADER